MARSTQRPRPSSIRVTRSPTVANQPPTGNTLARQSNEHPPATSCPGLRQLPVPHASEVVFSRQLQPPNCDHTPTGLEELVGLVDLEGTDGVERVVEDLTGGNRAEDDRVVEKDVIHGQDAGTGLSGIGDATDGLGSE